MLDHWLKRLNSDFGEFIDMLNSSQLGRSISIYREEIPALDNIQVALLGTGSFCNEIRRTLYQLEFPFKLQVVDLGDLANIQEAGVLPVITELMENNIIPIVLSQDETLVQIISQANKKLNKKCHPLLVDERIAYGKVLQRSYINHLTEKLNEQLEAITVLGYQKHISSLEPFNRDHDHMLHALRLSQIKSNPQGMEPYIRDCTTLSFSLNVLKKGEAPNKLGFNPSGLESETACQICRYAGLNEQMSAVLIHGMDMEKEQCPQTATLVAQMIWYFLDGLQNRMSEFPIVPEHLTEYLVTSSQWEDPLHFFKSLISGRWWMAHPLHIKDYDKMIPCTYEEYLSACRDEVPDRIISLLSMG